MSDGRRLDLLLVNPGSRARIYQALGMTLAAVEPPVWAGLIATFIRRRGFSVGVLDGDAEDLGADETAEQVAERDPTLTAVVVYGHPPSASTPNMTSARPIRTALKKRGPALQNLPVRGPRAAPP